MLLNFSRSSVRIFCWRRKISLRMVGFVEKIFSVLFLHDTRNTAGGIPSFFIIRVTSSSIFLFWGNMKENRLSSVVIDCSGMSFVLFNML